MNRLREDDIALAGEFVLDLLDPAEHARVQARLATDSAFAMEVEAWRERFHTLGGGSEAAVPDHLWTAIERSLPPASGQNTTRGRLRLWQGLTAACAALALYFGSLALQKPDAVPAPAPLVAALGDPANKNAIAARYDAGNGELLLTPVSLDTGKLYPELWIVPADGQARSLGMMAVDRPTRITVSPAMRPFMEQNAVLAITPEPFGGAPQGKATGPIIASGKITTL